MSRKRKLMILQRALGIMMVILTVIYVINAFGGTTPEERDITFALISMPMAVYALTTRHLLIRW